jgi:hypothetical protein
VLLSGYGNVPAERTTHLIGILLGIPVSAGFVDKAASRLDGRLQDTNEARSRGEPAADAELLAELRQRYDEAAAFGITHNRHRDRDDGNHPGYALGCWLRGYADQVWPFTREPAADRTNDLASHCTSCRLAAV